MSTKLRELISYLIFGVLTTLVNLAVFKLSNLFLGEELFLVSNVIAWVIAVAFAYVTNKLWVFSSKSWASEVVRRELPAFVSARIFSLVIEEAGLWLTLKLLGMNTLSWVISGYTVTGTDLWKLVMQIIVVILNYIFSKLIIFRPEKTKHP